MKNSWFEALDSEGSQQMKYLRDFMDSLNTMTCLPSQESIIQESQSEDMNQHIQACVHPEGRFLCAYLPSGGSCVLRTDRLHLSENQVYIWWWNPRDGKCHTAQADTVPVTEGGIHVCAPSSGPKEDWLLIVMSEKTGRPIKEGTYYHMEEKQTGRVFDW